MKTSIYTPDTPSTISSGPTQYLKNLFFPYFTGQQKLGQLLRVDVHAHWLPGVDDGAQTEKEALTIVRGLADLGYSKLIATPHIKETCPNEPKNLRRVFEHFKKTVRKAGIEIELALGAEYMLDEGFAKHLASGDLLTLHGKYLLVELNPNQIQILPALQKILFNIKVKGYTPILAHPERYAYYCENWNTMEGLKESGLLFQGNAMAVSGLEGKEMARRARKILDNGWYEFVGTDIHTTEHLKHLNKVALSQKFQNGEFQ
jgi:tyrosine-protein phosphatase YwqE